jgi:hypothetical protein
MEEVLVVKVKVKTGALEEKKIFVVEKMGEGEDFC